MNHFHDREAPRPLPLSQAQALHDTLHAHVLALRTQLQVAEKAEHQVKELLDAL